MSKKMDSTLKKCDELIDRLTNLRKALTALNVSSNRTPINALGAGWSQDQGTGSFHHSNHGVITTSKHPDGYYQITHGGRSVGRAASPAEAGLKIKNYVGSLTPGDTGQHNVDSMAMKDEDGLHKSNYGPRGGGQYSTADNAKRKARNVGDVVGQGPNVNAKAYSTKPGQLSAKQQAAKTPFKGAAGPVKQYSPEQIAAINEARKLKKNAEGQPWVTHAGVPNADREVEHIQKTNPAQKAEDIMSNQLANMMAGRAMLGTPPPRQPTDQEMFGHLVPSEEDLQKAESAWSNKMNWLEEAVKPICSRFNSPEEEQAYWDSIRVNGTNSKDDYGF